ncbi:hypothetical protein Tco_0519901 [Tanacetum coccineum]
MALLPKDQRHQYLRYEGLQYTDADIADFETRLGKIYMREVHRVQVLDFRILTDLMVKGLSSRMQIAHMDTQGQVLDLDTAEALQFQIGGVRHRMNWREFILTMGLHTAEEIESVRFGTPLSYTLIKDPMLRLCHRIIACSTAGRSQAPEKMTGAMISGGHFVARLVEHFGLLTEERLYGLTMIMQDHPLIDIAELHVIVAGAFEAAEDAPIADEGAPAIPVLVQAPQPPPPATGPARTMAQRLSRVEEDVHEI